MLTLRRNWFPLVVAAVWVLLSALAILDFASFDAATRQGHEQVALHVQ